MKIHESIGHLSGEEQVLLRRVKNIIVDNLRPVAIYYFGSTFTTTIDRSSFARPQMEATSHFTCYLLILLPNTIHANKNTDKMVTELTQELAQVHALIHQVRFAKIKMFEGNLFFNWVRRSGIKLYDRGDAEIELPFPIKKRPEWVKQAHDFFMADVNMPNYLTEKLESFIS